MAKYSHYLESSCDVVRTSIFLIINLFIKETILVLYNIGHIVCD